MEKLETEDFNGNIEDLQIDNGIVISNMELNGILVYLFILDNTFFFIKRTNLPQFKEYFDKNVHLFIFDTPECKDNSFKAISSIDQPSKLYLQRLFYTCSNIDHLWKSRVNQKILFKKLVLFMGISSDIIV